jgi:hypothetical protein
MMKEEVTFTTPGLLAPMAKHNEPSTELGNVNIWCNGFSIGIPFTEIDTEYPPDLVNR